MYQEALRLHQKERYSEAKSIYEEILADELIQDGSVTMDSSKASNVKSTPLIRLRFLVFKNYASLLEHELHASDTDTAKKAISYYLKAANIDDSDQSLWYCIGNIAYESGNTRLARLAYENGFFLMDLYRTGSHDQFTVPEVLDDMLSSMTLSPIQWLCMERLCKVLVDIGDYDACRTYMRVASRQHPNWPLRRILEERMDATTTLDEPEMTEAPLDDTVSINITKMDWKTLLESLLSRYKDIIEDKKSSTPSFINNAIHLDVEADVNMSSIPETETAVAPITVDEPEDTQMSGTTEQDAIGIHSPSERHSSPALPLSSQEMDAQPDNDDNPEITNTMKRKRSMDDTGDNERGDKESDQQQQKEDDEEEQEEEEEEDKRASLRISRRQKEKIENEESSKRKMLEEEIQLTNLVQSLFDMLPDDNTMNRSNSQYYHPISKAFNTVDMNSFWKWFDTKVSELGRNVHWEFDNSRFNRMHEQSNLENKDARLYATFTVSETTQSPTPSVNNTPIQGFIEQVNTSNSGITDVLCSLIIQLLLQSSKAELANQHDLFDLLIESTVILYPTLLDQIMYGEWEDNESRMKVVLSICEHLVDKLINSILSFIEATTSKRKSATAKQSLETPIREYTRLCNSWIGIFERLVMENLLDALSLASTMDGDNNTLSNDHEEIMLRYWFLKGKLGQCEEDVEQACNWYQRCKEFLSNNSTQSSTIYLNCRYDALISMTTINEKLLSMELGRKLLIAKSEYKNKNYSRVISELGNVIESKASSMTRQETYDVLSLLTKSYTEMKDYKNQGRCLLYTFSQVMEDLVRYGSSQTTSGHNATKESDMEFLKCLKRIESCLRDLLGLIHDGKVGLTDVMDNKSGDALLIALQMTVYYIFRHPDFIPLVNNFKIHGVEPHVPSQVTRSSSFNVVLVEIWVLLSTFMQDTANIIDNETAKTIKDKLAETLITLHDELGEREICGVSKGIFLKHLLNLLATESKTQYRIGIYQCYHCLYGLHLDADSDNIEEHNANHEKLDQKAAEALFALVVDSVVKRLNKGAPLRNDLKDVVDTVSDLFQSLPTNDSRIQLNQAVITNYLANDIKLQHSISDMMRESSISANHIYPERSSASSVYFKIFWIGGKVLRMQIKNRAKVNPEKTMDDLEEAVDLFTNHVILNPYDINGWSELGQCLLHLADEELIWSATNINSHRYRIAEYHRKAYYAFWRAWYLLRVQGSEGIESSALYDLFNTFGMLLYSMTCPPMYGAAFRPKMIRRAITRVKQSLDPTITSNAYKLAVVLFGNALKYRSSDKSEWRCFTMLAKCYKKLNRPAKEVLDFLAKALENAPQRNAQYGSQGKILEPIYKLCSVLAKYLYKGDINAEDVMHYLKFTVDQQQEQQKQQQQQQNTENVNEDNGPPDDWEPVMHIRENGPNPSDMAAYGAIYKTLLECTKADKKGWHHRPVYRQAWMQYRIYGSSKQALQHMKTLFSLKTGKTLASIWKPAFERPGKYFEYVHEYTMFLIQLCAECKDEECIRILKEKLSKTSSILLYSDEAITAADKAYEQIHHENTANQEPQAESSEQHNQEQQQSM
ncbi:hypothetical protein K492DRAFT_208427 [Lichtheimia hyalospora FSU 10163]|nr:hypothetical protein K492DRAFT_208427 [Lichtheimia hyalospora FSU 10163]